MNVPIMNMPIIEFDHVGFSYEGEPALCDVSFRVNEGEAVALLGPNGCGKTTALRIVAGLEFAQEGTFRFARERIDQAALANELAAKRYHQRVGFVFQDPDTQLFCSSVAEEVAFGPAQMGLSADDMERRVTDALALFDVVDLADRAPYHLSGGQKKRVALAAVVAMNPSVLVLDEPLSGLDEESEERVIEFLRAYVAAGKTVLAATHRRSFVEALGARPVRIDRYHRVVEG